MNFFVSFIHCDLKRASRDTTSLLTGRPSWYAGAGQHMLRCYLDRAVRKNPNHAVTRSISDDEIHAMHTLLDLCVFSNAQSVILALGPTHPRQSVPGTTDPYGLVRLHMYVEERVACGSFNNRNSKMCKGCIEPEKTKTQSQ